MFVNTILDGEEDFKVVALPDAFSVGESREIS